MNPDDLILISVDDHIAEPANMFDAHVPARYADYTPRVVVPTDRPEVLTAVLAKWPAESIRAAAA